MSKSCKLVLRFLDMLKIRNVISEHFLRMDGLLFSIIFVKPTFVHLQQYIKHGYLLWSEQLPEECRLTIMNKKHFK